MTQMTPNNTRSRVPDWISFVVLLLATVISCNLFIAIKNTTKNAFAEMTVVPSNTGQSILAFSSTTLLVIAAILLVFSLGLTIKCPETHWVTLTNLTLSTGIVLAAFIATWLLAGCELIPRVIEFNDLVQDSNR